MSTDRELLVKAADLIRDADNKLMHYRREHGSKYVGGVEYTTLRLRLGELERNILDHLNQANADEAAKGEG